jgi:hypothetical protein
VASKLIYIVVGQLLAWARLSGRAEVSKDVEILVLRHQLAGAQRRLPPREQTRPRRRPTARIPARRIGFRHPQPGDIAPMTPIPWDVYRFRLWKAVGYRGKAS